MDVVFAETTTLGVRISSVSKHTLEREWLEVDAAGYPVRVKVGRRGGTAVTVAPEYEDAGSAARAAGRPLKEIYSIATEAARRITSGSP
jgi:uncharacterized protein (DUF111 family)